jgi:hypothetical protein
MMHAKRQAFRSGIALIRALAFPARRAEVKMRSGPNDPEGDTQWQR